MRSISLIAIVTLCLLSAGTKAGVVYDNFSTSMSFDCCAGGGVGSQSDEEIGFIFSPSHNGYLSNIHVAASTYSGSAEIIFTLYSDSAGVPGSILEVFHLSQLPDFNTAFSPQNIIASGGTFLDSSQSYWLIASHPNSPDISVWNNSLENGATVAFRNSTFTSWVIMPHEWPFALRVEVRDLNVAIDIEPGKNTENVLNLKKDKNLNVAVIHDTKLDATQVDPSTVTFGPANASPTRYQIKDVDHDGDADMLLTFSVKESGIDCETTSATLIGAIGSGEGFVGTDTFTVEPCP